MILTTAPQHEAILSNVGEIGEFRIRNSAKAFSILSSGLYANKIRAIVRELSCNAVDSHVAAGRVNTPFDVHLPNAMEPWFAVRDYGVGLNHEQVVNIYTTYFESTKTDSNAYIGALGLGSKSPFSYTDNFTVTAIQNGTKGIYSAFINGEGVPSIVKMMEESTTDPNGVEVKFSVNERWDYSKFKEEAATVYSHFKLQPVVSGSNDFKIREIQYKTRDIIPGVHEADNYHSVAVMGNIAYPIEVPNANTVLGDLSKLLGCGLIIEFEIGELDFQASREGLSYIPQTISSIKRKLEQINKQLTVYVTDEADKIDNLWTRAAFLMEKSRSKLWTKSVSDYIVTTKFPLIDAQTWGVQLNKIKFNVDELAAKYNIKLKSYNRAGASHKIQMVEQRPESFYTRDDTGHSSVHHEYGIYAESLTTFVISDVKVGPIERVKHHYRNIKESTDKPVSKYIHVMIPADKTKPMKTQKFLQAVYNPTSVVQVSELLEKPRKANDRAKNVTIMKLQRKDTGLSYYNRNDGHDLVWRDAGKSDEFDSKETYYYLELTGFQMITEHNHGMTAQVLAGHLKSSKLDQLNRITVYGVRKGDLDYIKTQPNWVNLETHVISVLGNLSQEIINGLVKSTVDEYDLLKYNSTIISQITDPDSKYKTLVEKYKNTVRIELSSSLVQLLKKYTPEVELEITKTKSEVVDECRAVYDNYPMFNVLTTGYIRDAAWDLVADYINLVDRSNKI